MSQVDTVFNALPGPLLQQWGQDVTYIKFSATDTYVPSRGEVLNTSTRTTVRVLVTQLKPEEFDSTYQTTDVKMLLGNAELGTYTPSIRDQIEYTDNGTLRTGRIINVKTYKGERPIMHTLIVRPQ
jgi:hypothetical protein